MNVRTTAGPEPSASAEQVDLHAAPTAEGSKSATSVGSAGEGSESNDANFEAKMRAQLTLITAASESDASTTADPKIEEIADCRTGIVCPAEIGKLGGKKQAVLQRLSDRPNRVSAETPLGARPSKSQDFHRKNSSAAAGVGRSGALTAESVAMAVPLIGCEPPARVMDSAPGILAQATSLDSAQWASSVQPGSLTPAATSKQKVLTNTWNPDSNVAALEAHSQQSSVVSSGLQSAQKPIAGEQANDTGVSTQANFARRFSTGQGEQFATESSLFPAHSSASSLARPLIANASETGGAVDPESNAPEYRSSPVATGNPMIDAVSAPSSSASDQSLQMSTLSAPETRKGSKSSRPSSADEFIEAPNRAHASSAHTISQANENATRVVESNPPVAVTPRSADEQKSQFQIKEAFTALESGAAAEPGYRAVQHGGRFQAEAGFQDPSLGWIGVRAETHAGALHATVLSTSNEAAQALSGHIAWLHAYLADRNTPVESLTLLSTSGFGEQATARDSRGGAHQGSGDPGGRDSIPESQESSRRLTAGSHSLAGVGPLDVAPIHPAGNSTGARISVLA